VLKAEFDESTWRKRLKDHIAGWTSAGDEYLGDNPFPPFVYVQTAESWDDFLQWRKPLEGRYGFRGQKDAKWNLSSSIDRVLVVSGRSQWTSYTIQKDSLNYEPDLLFEYQQQAHQFLSSLPDENDLVSWLALMQHHGTPTRLLDWTTSSHVAAYFAVEEKCELAAIWAIDLGWMEDKGNELLQADGHKPIPYVRRDRTRYLNRFLKKAGSPEQAKMLVRVEPKTADAWMRNQKGFFLAKSWNTPSVNQLLMSMMIHPTATDGPVVRKLEITGDLRFEFLRNLQSVNIHRGSLFPDLDGFSRALRLKLEIQMDDLRQSHDQEAANFDLDLLRDAAQRRSNDDSE
jgi:hypothetical protein